MAKKKFDPKAKAKRQKVIAAVGGVILLGVLAFQVPRTLKMLHQSNANAADTTPTATTSNTTATGPIAAPSLGGGNATASAASNVSSDGVNDPDVLPAPQSGQLLAFSRFRSKDPFSQQIGLDCSSGDSQQACASTSSGTSSGGTKPPVKSPGGTVTTTTTVSPSRGGTAAKLTSAVISVNGTSETVHVGASFPASAPTFKLVALTKTSARVGIAGGSLASGNQTVTLKLNKQLTLMNTADGTRYVLRLLSVK
jgi:hypothetical protein